MCPPSRLLVLSLLLVPSPGAFWGDDDSDADRLGMSTPVVCVSVKGFRDYVERPEPVLTKDEKLVVYLEPRHFTIGRYKTLFRANLSIDGRIRRRGEKAVLRKKDDAVKYEVKSKDRPEFLYLTTSVSLKDLSPGEYDLDLILHDRLSDDARATTTVKFRVKPIDPDPAEPKNDGPVLPPRGAVAKATRETARSGGPK